MSETFGRKKETIEGLHEQLKTIVRMVSGRYDLEVTTTLPPSWEARMRAEGKDLNEVWMRATQSDPKTRKTVKEFVYIPPVIMEASENIAKGKAAHEAAHVAITRRERFADELPKAPGFGAIAAAVEERPTDQYVRKIVPGAGRWLDEARRDSLEEGQEMKAKMDLRNIPRFSQLSNLIVYEPHYRDGEVAAEYSPEVIELYEQIRDAVERNEHLLPDDYDDEERRIAIARERDRIIEEDIWPQLEEMAAEDMHDESLQQLLDMLTNMTDEERAELGRMMEELAEAIKEVLEEMEAAMEGEGGSGSESDSEPEGEDGGSFGENPIALKDLPEDIQEKLEKAFEELPEEKQQELEAKAEEKLREIEEQAVEEMQSELEHDASEEIDKEESEDEREAPPVERRDPKDIERELAEAEREMEERLAAMHSEKTRYDEVYREMLEHTEDLYRKLEDIFYPNVKSKVGLASSGNKINLPALFRWEAARAAGAAQLDSRVFERRVQPEARDYAFTLLVDLSGSMNGQKIQEAFKGALMLTEALNRVGVKTEVLGFQDEIVVFKSFDEEMNDGIRNRMSGMELEVSSRNPGGHNRASYNDDGPCLQEASERLTQQPQPVKFLTVISDGEPAGRRSDERDLHRAVEHVMNNTDQHLLGLGLGRGTNHVREYYPTSVANIDARDFPETLAAILVDTMENPQNY